MKFSNKILSNALHQKLKNKTEHFNRVHLLTASQGPLMAREAKNFGMTLLELRTQPWDQVHTCSHGGSWRRGTRSHSGIPNAETGFSRCTDTSDGKRRDSAGCHTGTSA